jgi:hypothetical protein
MRFSLLREKQDAQKHVVNDPTFIEVYKTKHVCAVYVSA